MLCRLLLHLCLIIKICHDLWPSCCDLDLRKAHIKCGITQEVWKTRRNKRKENQEWSISFFTVLLTLMLKMLKSWPHVLGGFLYSICYNESFCLSDKSFFPCSAWGKPPLIGWCNKHAVQLQASGQQRRCFTAQWMCQLEPQIQYNRLRLLGTSHNPLSISSHTFFIHHVLCIH